MRERRAILIRGIVQGVGFRPFVHNLAVRLGLVGFVRNQTGIVFIEAEGESVVLERFVAELADRPPPLALVEQMSWEERPPCGERDFRIVASEADAAGAVFISPDVALCRDCLAELLDPADRRYRYPFLNCTNCGPRLTIITGAPYDRPRTTMAAFPMCDACRTEYEDPTNRRFHAQPTACAACGPWLALRDAAGNAIPTSDPLAVFAAAALRPFLAADGAADARHVDGPTPKRPLHGWRFGLAGAALATVVLTAATLILWAAGVVRVRTSEGTIVLEQLPADADVLVDGEKVTLKLGDHGEFEIGVVPGTPHQLQVKKDGFKVFAQEVEVAAGNRRPVTVRLEREAPADKPAPPDDEGFVPLFDGKDLKGWETFDGGFGGWTVEDGAIVGRGHVPDLYTHRSDFEDFHLRVEAMINDGGETGILFRTGRESRYPHAYNARINFTGAYRQKTGSLNGISPFFEKLCDPDKWFTLEVIARGEHIVIKVNGTVTADLSDRRFIKGYFALKESDVPTVVRYRKIEVKTLPVKADP